MVAAICSVFFVVRSTPRKHACTTFTALRTHQLGIKPQNELSHDKALQAAISPNSAQQL